eukprot:scaffold80429_cov31-Tisochrysis_lutea.AAC.1
MVSSEAMLLRVISMDVRSGPLASMTSSRWSAPEVKTGRATASAARRSACGDSMSPKGAICTADGPDIAARPLDNLPVR